MIEIGSEFWNIPTTEAQNEFLTDSLSWYISGRSALYGILEELRWAKTVAMPSWCCESMIKPFIDSGIDVHFYPVVYQGEVIQEPKTDCDILVLIDYFGYTNDVTKEHNCIIRDVTHSFFSKRYVDANYYFGSLRKWCGFLTGGIAWTGKGKLLKKPEGKNTAYCDLRRRAMEEKSRYLEKVTTSRADSTKGYLQMFKDAEAMLDEPGIIAAADEDIKIAKHLDVGTMRTKRRRNATCLMNELKEYLMFPKMQSEDCPLFVPIMVPAGLRDGLRERLINNQIFCPAHWPISKYHKLNEEEQVIYNNELSLICDQRYDEKDMRRISKCVKDYIEERRCH